MEDAAPTGEQPPHRPTRDPQALGAGPGILVLTPLFKLLYMNEEARRLCNLLNTRRVCQKVSGVVPVEIFELCDEGLKNLGTRSELKEWEQFQLTRMAGEPECPVLLRCLGLPDPGGLSLSRLLILMEMAPRQKEPGTGRLKDRFNLTYREQGVILYLIKGLTNKEIAVRMDVTEQTIKEYIRHIMGKTGTTTRTGLISKIIFACPDQFSHDHGPSAGPA